MKSDYNLEFNQVVTVEPVIYGDFMVPNADPRVYAEIEDFKLVIFSIIMKKFNLMKLF
jgi:dynein heavy chain